MSNHEVAEVFREMADLLRIDGGEAHRAKAFERTAEILENLAEPAAELLRFGRLAKVKGIGPGSVDRIKEVLKTGTCADHRRLRARVPKGLRDVLQLRDVGPALVRQLWVSAGVVDVPSLEAAVSSGMLLRLPGIGPRTVELLSQSLLHERRHVRRLRLPDALALGEHVQRQLEQHPACVRAVQVGSARRREETVGDLDFVAGSFEPGALVKAFSELPFVDEVLLRAPTRGSVRAFEGRQVDLWVVPPESLGAALHAFSGRKPHVVEMRKRANARGLHLSELGIFRDGEQLAPGTHEEEIFAAVGLPFIPPELRQAAGELEAAEKQRLPALVELSQLLGDTRVMAPDDDRLLRAMLIAARAAGRRWVLLHLTSTEALRERGDALRALGAELGVEVWAALLLELTDAAALPLSREEALVADWVTVSLDDGTAASRTASLEAACESGLVDAIARPLARRALEDAEERVDVERLMRSCAQHGVALELCADPDAYDLDARACRLARERGVLVALASASEEPDHLEGMRWALYQARRGWLSARDTVSSLSSAQLRERRAARLGVPLERLRRREAFPTEAVDARATETSREDDVASLRRELARGEAMSDAVLLRLERWLQEGGDAALEQALAEGAAPPLQRAFELSLLARGARTSRR